MAWKLALWFFVSLIINIAVWVISPAWGVILWCTRSYPTHNNIYNLQHTIIYIHKASKIIYNHSIILLAHHTSTPNLSSVSNPAVSRRGKNTHTHMYTHTHTHVHTKTPPHTHTDWVTNKKHAKTANKHDVKLQTHTHTHTHSHACAHTHTHSHACAHTHTHKYKKHSKTTDQQVVKLLL